MKSHICLSSAGSGKTTALINKIKEITKYIDSSRIIVISFTNSSCRDIEERIKSKGIPPVEVKTLHSFCLSFLKDYLYITNDIKYLIKLHFYKFKYLQHFSESEIENMYFTWKSFFSPLKAIDDINRDLCQLFSLIEEEKNKRKVIVFQDVLLNFLKEDDYLNIYNRYDFLGLDETQDFSIVQLEVLKRLIKNVFIEENKGFLMVGDVKQSIYDFQGADPVSYISFLEEIRNMCIRTNKELIIEEKKETYRFGGKILDEVNKIYDKHISSIENGEISIIDVKDEYLSTISHILEDLLKTNNPEEITVIYQRNSSLIENLQNRFSQYGMNLKVFIQNHPIIIALKDICHMLMNNDESHLWYSSRYLQGPFFNIAEPDFLISAREGKILELVKEDYEKLYLLFNNSFESLLFLRNKLHGEEGDKILFEELLRRSIGGLSLYSFLNSLPDTLNIKKKGLKFSPVHSYKGMENENIIFINLPDKRIQYSFNKEGFFDFKERVVEDSKNLLYVAYTRARAKLVVLNIIDEK